MAEQARAATGIDAADRGGRPRLLQGRADLACDEAGITPIVPKSMTSNSQAEGRFDKQDFIYIASDDEYRCPAGQRAIKRFTTDRERPDVAQVLVLGLPAVPAQGASAPPSDYRRIARWEHEAVLEAMQAAGSAARDDASATTNGRASVRNDQVLDGVDPLPDANAGARAHRDESARPGLQPEARDAHPGY